MKRHVHVQVGAHGTRRRPIDPRGLATWKINGEKLMTFAGWPAILLQFAHPLVAAGVADHSAFGSDLHGYLRRLDHTLDAMLALTFGTPEEAERAAAGIRKIHDRVHGTIHEPTAALPAATTYTAHDPALLRWVHATLLYVTPFIYELYIGPLTPAEKDAFCAESSLIGPLLGTPQGYLPMTMAELEAYMNTMLAGGTIAVTPTARALARELLAPPFPLPARPLVWLVRLPAVALLPPALRDAYGFTWNTRQELVLRLSAWLIRRVLPLVPSARRFWPAAYRALTTPRHAA